MCWIHSLIFRNRRGHDTRAHSMFRIYAYMCNTMVLCRHALNAGPYAALLGGFAHISEHVTRTSGMLTCSAFDTFMCTSVKHAFGASETCILVTCLVDDTWWCDTYILYACIWITMVLYRHAVHASDHDALLGGFAHRCVLTRQRMCILTCAYPFHHIDASFDTHKPFVELGWHVLNPRSDFQKSEGSWHTCTWNVQHLCVHV